jgi:hypothetical protein
LFRGGRGFRVGACRLGGNTRFQRGEAGINASLWQLFGRDSFLRRDAQWGHDHKAQARTGQEPVSDAHCCYSFKIKLSTKHQDVR